jgi:hypothetical protein
MAFVGRAKAGSRVNGNEGWMACRRIVQLAAASVIGVTAMSGCGGGSDNKQTSAPAAATTSAPAPATTTETTAATTETTAAAGSTGLTAMGSTLKMGATAVIAYNDSSTHKHSSIQVTPRSIEKGSIGDFKNIKLDANQKSATPFYVKVSVKNVGKGDLSGSDPGSYIDGVDDRGQEQNEVIFFGDFERCNDANPKSLKAGESYDTCLTYLIPKGGSIVGMRWIAFDEKSGKSNIDWK